MNKTCCNLNANDISEHFDQYDYGWDFYLHCRCHVCDLKRQEQGVDRCVDKSCDGCKNKSAGKKIRSWAKDMMKGK